MDNELITQSILVYSLDFFILMLEHYLIFCGLIWMLFIALTIATLLSLIVVKGLYDSTVSSGRAIT